ncbi:hypothetical protein M23134_00901 [Microscilla marina ATCC 23134]|uniref:Uncharacterized protein n=1 Tax=Microscilla marina ATCC 23134 TaxID=313606 RepID=A1ZZL6_MICM2|nr:hypothetical protein M23134_00901 [Microscilla marina ATCC 23134]
MEAFKELERILLYILTTQRLINFSQKMTKFTLPVKTLPQVINGSQNK